VLPDRWWRGLRRSQVCKVVSVERAVQRGRIPLQPTPHPDGYRWVFLPRCHPYARRGGSVLLHRYLVERALGRRLQTWEHVHHRPGAPLDSRRMRDLRICEVVEHAIFHLGRRARLAREFTLWAPRDYYGRFTPYPTAAALGEASREGP
jgi:hypothetical protein